MNKHKLKQNSTSGITNPQGTSESITWKDVLYNKIIKKIQGNNNRIICVIFGPKITSKYLTEIETPKELNC